MMKTIADKFIHVLWQDVDVHKQMISIIILLMEREHEKGQGK